MHDEIAQLLNHSCIYCELSNLFKNTIYPRSARPLQYEYLKMADWYVVLSSICHYSFPWWRIGACLGIRNRGNQKHGTGAMHTMQGSSECNRISVSFIPHFGREVVITWFNSTGCCEFTLSKIFLHGILKMDGFESPSPVFLLTTLHCTLLMSSMNATGLNW